MFCCLLRLRNRLVMQPCSATNGSADCCATTTAKRPEQQRRCARYRTVGRNQCVIMTFRTALRRTKDATSSCITDVCRALPKQAAIR
jgi:hypothetical protein